MPLRPDFNLTGKSKQSQTLSACGRDMDFFVGFSSGFCSSSVFVPPSSLPKTIPDNPRARADRKVAKLRPEVIIGFTVTLMIISIGMVSVSQFPQYSALLGTGFPSGCRAVCGRSQDLWRWRSIGTRRGQDLDRIWRFTEITETEELCCAILRFLKTDVNTSTMRDVFLSQQFHCLHHISGADKLDVQ